MTMSAPPVPVNYVMLECGCRGVVAEPLLVHEVLMCPRHLTNQRYVLEHTLRLPLHSRLSPLRFFRWLGTKPKSKREAVLKLSISFEIGVVTFSVLYLIAKFALRG